MGTFCPGAKCPILWGWKMLLVMGTQAETRERASKAFEFPLARPQKRHPGFHVCDCDMALFNCTKQRITEVDGDFQGDWQR